MTKIGIVISLTLRAVYLAAVTAIALALLVAVGMGFDSGANFFSISVSCLYAFTFLPAIIITFIPVKSLLHPNIFIKTWYYWLVCIICLYIIYYIYTISYLAFESITNNTVAGKVCYVFENKDNLPHDNIMPTFDVKYMNLEPERAWSFFNYKNQQFCQNVGTGLNPLTVYAYTSTENNRGARSARKSDIISNSVTANIIPNGQICFYVRREEISETNQSGWFVYSKKCDIDNHSLKNLIFNIFKK